MKNRIAWIDITKAIEICFVVLGHTGVPVQSQDHGLFENKEEIIMKLRFRF